MDQNFKVKVGEFEGPLAVLLDLIEKRKLHISQVSLATVTDDYLVYLQTHPELPPAELANFILVASTLILIKSLTLLPTLSVTPEEQASIEELEERLKLYAQTETQAAILKRQWAMTPSLLPIKDRPFMPVFIPAPDASLQTLTEVLKQLVANLPIAEKIPERVVRKIISLEEVITNLTRRIQQSISLRWSQLVDEARGEKQHLIVNFLGLLELTKQGLIVVRQENHLGEINLEQIKNPTGS